MSTPLSNRELLDQKFTAVGLLIRSFLLPFALLLLFDGYWKVDMYWKQLRGQFELRFTLYIISNVLTVVIYASMLAWLGVLVGLRVRNQARAIFISLLLIIVWSILPLLLASVLEITIDDSAALLLLSSPLTFLVWNQIGGAERLAGWTTIELFLVNSLIHGSAWGFFRWLCVSRLDRYLNRADSAHQPRTRSGGLNASK